MEKLTARDIMVQEYVTIAPDASVQEAARLIFEGKARETGYKPFGIIVIDEIGRLLAWSLCLICFIICDRPS